MPPTTCPSWAGLSLFLPLFPLIWNGPWPSPPPASAHVVQAPGVGFPAEGIPARSLMDGEQKPRFPSFHLKADGDLLLLP